MLDRVEVVPLLIRAAAVALIMQDSSEQHAAEVLLIAADVVALAGFLLGLLIGLAGWCLIISFTAAWAHGYNGLKCLPMMWPCSPRRERGRA